MRTTREEIAVRDGGHGSRERDRRPRGRSRGSERGSTAAGRISTKPGLSSPTCLSGRAFRPPRSGHRLLPAEGCGWWAVAQGPKQSSLPAAPRRFSLTRPLLPSRPVLPPAAGRSGSARLGKVRGSRADRCAECRRLPCARNPVLRDLFVSCAGQRGHSHEGKRLTHDTLRPLRGLPSPRSRDSVPRVLRIPRRFRATHGLRIRSKNNP